MPDVRLHDGSTIEIEIHGAGPTLLMPVNPARSKAGRPRKCGRGAPIRPLAAP
ncbi:MAG: alpha/beta hydrolase [Chloroflexi bacterium]|nr:alpha/beta hydrolase [Chloroflexota bacterium]